MLSQIGQRLKVPEAAKYVGLSKSCLDKKRVMGGGPRYIKLGQRVFYDITDLDTWMAGNRRRSTSDMSGATDVL
ncbi:helix-turn-helix transcriptional regulator [Xanthobacter autotrophicus]|uniref:helix-turn-helix transcriptional regulator n=1 Tax=Xanthobacter autotrophicus TaxID=280 RepID=UPI00372C478D